MRQSSAPPPSDASSQLISSGEQGLFPLAEKWCPTLPTCYHRGPSNQKAHGRFARGLFGYGRELSAYLSPPRNRLKIPDCCGASFFGGGGVGRMVGALRLP